MSVNLTKISDYVTKIESGTLDLDAEWGAWLESTYDPDTQNGGHDSVSAEDAAQEAWDNRNNPEWWDHS